MEFAPVYFNWTRVTVKNHRFKLENFFQELLHLIDMSINEESGSIFESIES